MIFTSISRRMPRAIRSTEISEKYLGGDYTEEEIRLVRIKFMCEQGN